MLKSQSGDGNWEVATKRKTANWGVLKIVNDRSYICHSENQNIGNVRYLIRVSFYF